MGRITDWKTAVGTGAAGAAAVAVAARLIAAAARRRRNQRKQGGQDNKDEEDGNEVVGHVLQLGTQHITLRAGDAALLEVKVHEVTRKGTYRIARKSKLRLSAPGAWAGVLEINPAQGGATVQSRLELTGKPEAESAELNVEATTPLGSHSATVQLTLAPDPTLECNPRSIELPAMRGGNQVFTVSVENPGQTEWQFEARFEDKDTPMTVAIEDGDKPSVKYVRVTDAVPPGTQRPGRAEDSHKLILTATNPAAKAGEVGAKPLEQDGLAILLWEGLFLSTMGRSNDDRWYVKADRTKGDALLDFYALTIDPAGKAENDARRQGLDGLQFGPDEKESRRNKNLAEAAQLEIKFLQFRPSNQPSAGYRIHATKPLPGNGDPINVSYRATLPDRDEDLFSVVIPLAIVPMDTEPRSKEWEIELERCRKIINDFVPAGRQNEYYKLVNERKLLLGAEGLFTLRHTIWQRALDLHAEGAKYHEEEALWNDRIVNLLEYTKWGADLAFGAVLGTLVGPYAVFGNLLKEYITSALVAHAEGKDPESWRSTVWNQIKTTFEGKVIDVDMLSKLGTSNKAILWAIYCTYYFAKGVWYEKKSITEAALDTLREVRDELLAEFFGAHLRQGVNSGAIKTGNPADHEPAKPTDPNTIKPGDGQKAKTGETGSAKPNEPNKAKPIDSTHEKPVEPTKSKPADPTQIPSKDGPKAKSGNAEKSRAGNADTAKPSDPTQIKPTDPTKAKPAEPDLGRGKPENEPTKPGNSDEADAGNGKAPKPPREDSPKPNEKPKHQNTPPESGVKPDGTKRPPADPTKTKPTEPDLSHGKPEHEPTKAGRPDEPEAGDGKGPKPPGEDSPKPKEKPKPQNPLLGSGVRPDGTPIPGPEKPSTNDRNMAWHESKAAGKKKFESFKKALESGTPEQQKVAALAIQADKQALWEINRSGDDRTKQAMIDQMKKIYDEVDRATKKEIATQLNAKRKAAEAAARARGDHELANAMHKAPDIQPDEIQVFNPTNPKTEIKVGADRDVTMRYQPKPGDIVYVPEPGKPGSYTPGRVAADGTVTVKDSRGNEIKVKAEATDVPHSMLEKAYNKHFYEQVTGKPGAEAGTKACEEVARTYDQCCTDRLHPEAYGRFPWDLETAMNHPGRGFTDPQQVGMAAAYKGQHWFKLAEKARVEGNHGEAETDMAEGMRQMTKQWKNQVARRREALAWPPHKLVLNPPPPKLQKAIDLMKQVEDQKLTPAQAEAELQKLGYTPDRVATDVGKQIEILQKLQPPPGELDTNRSTCPRCGNRLYGSFSDCPTCKTRF